MKASAAAAEAAAASRERDKKRIHFEDDDDDDDGSGGESDEPEFLSTEVTAAAGRGRPSFLAESIYLNLAEHDIARAGLDWTVNSRASI